MMDGETKPDNDDPCPFIQVPYQPILGKSKENVVLGWRAGEVTSGERNTAIGADSFTRVTGIHSGDLSGALMNNQDWQRMRKQMVQEAQRVQQEAQRMKKEHDQEWQRLRDQILGRQVREVERYADEEVEKFRAEARQKMNAVMQVVVPTVIILAVIGLLLAGYATARAETRKVKEIEKRVETLTAPAPTPQPESAEPTFDMKPEFSK